MMAVDDSRSPGATVTPIAIAKRRTRNRVAQRSFRERQARYVKELEQKVAQTSQSEGLRLKTAEQECHRLREALMATKTRILGMCTALSGIADNIDASLNCLTDTIEVGLSKDQNSFQDSDGPDQEVEGQADSLEDVEAPDAALYAEDTTDLLVNHPVHESETIHASDVSQDISGIEPEHFLSGLDQVSWIDGQQNNAISNNPMLPSTSIIQPAVRAQQSCNHIYTDFIDHETARWPLDASQSETTQVHFPFFTSASPGDSMKFPLMNVGFPPGAASFPSIFSAHLAVCEYFTKQNQAYRDRLQPRGKESYAKLITTMVNMFVNTCWPDMRIWWAYIQSSTVVEKLVRWKLDPCLETYKSLPMTHRPTALQLCTAHPDIIDWAFFPSIRDRMIELYSHSWMLDEVVCELVNAYVVEADLTKLVTGMENCPARRGYFSIWDIVQTISRESKEVQPAQPNSDLWGNELHLDEGLFAGPTSPFEIDQPGNETTWIKMPFDQIYQSRKAALKLFKLLHMEDRRTVKVDPVFAAAHPELCDDVSIVATGIDCTLRGSNTPVPRPKPLTREAIVNYKMMLWKANM